MNIYEKNIECMKETRKELYDKLICAEKIQPADVMDVQVFEAKKNGSYLQVKYKDADIRLNSSYRPYEEASKWAEQYNYKNIEVHAIIFGMGNALFLREIIKRMNEDGVIFLYEPSLWFFCELMKIVDIMDILKEKKVYIFIKEINDYEFERTLSDELHWVTIPTQIVAHHPSYDILFSSECLKFYKLIRKTNSLEMVNKDTNAYFSHSLTENIIKNLHFIRKSNYITEITDKIPKDLPAIVVAAGPSLDINIDELKRAEGKAFIIATDTAVRSLIKHDVKFDCMVTLDPRKPSGYISDPKCCEVPLFCVLESNNEIMEFHKGRKIWFKGGRYLEDLYKAHNRKFAAYNPGGSVATAAFSICAALDFERIVLIGQDLAYKGDVTHAGGEISGIVNEDKILIETEGIDGTKVKTRYDWNIYREWFEESITELKNSDIIDATEGGALIHGTKIMKLSEVIDEYCNKEFDISEVFMGLNPTFDDNEYEKVKKELLHFEKEMKNIREKSELGLKNCEKIRKMIDKNPSDPVIDDKIHELMKTNNFIEKQKMFIILDYYIADVVAEAMKTIFMVSDDEENDRKETIISAECIYKALIDADDDLDEIFKTSMENIRNEI